MSGIHSVTHHLNGALSDTFQKAFRIMGQLYGRSFRAIEKIPQLMKKNPNIAIGVIVATNAVFFTIINTVANWLNKRFENHPEPITSGQSLIRYIILDGILVGGSVFAFNCFLSNATKYPLSNLTLAAITTAAIAVRYFACHGLSEDEKALKLAEAAAKKAQEEEAAKKAQEEAAAKKAQEEEAAKKAQEEESAKKAQEEEAAKKAQEEEAAKKAQEEAPAGPEDGICFASSESKAKYMLKECKEEGLRRLDALIQLGDKLLDLPEHNDYDKITQRTGKFIWAVMQTFPQNEAIKQGSPQERVKVMHDALKSASADELNPYA